MTTTTHPQIQQYLDNAALFTEVVDTGGSWDAASPCAGWSARDVLDHVIETQRSFLAQREVDLGPAPTGEPAEAWRDHLNAIGRVVADHELVSREYDGYFGSTTIAATLATFYGFDLLVHRWDLARGLGRDIAFSEAEQETIETALDGFGEHLYDDGVCAPAVPVPDEAPRQVRLLARMGRAV